MRKQFGTVGCLGACIWHIPRIKTGKGNSKEILQVAGFRAMRDLHNTMKLGMLTMFPWFAFSKLLEQGTGFTTIH